MSEAKMMKVKSDVKERVEELKKKFKVGSESDVIEKLLQYWDKQPRHVELPEETMTEVKKCKEYLRVNSEADVIQVTQLHFDTSLQMNFTTFEKLQDLQRRRW